MSDKKDTKLYAVPDNIEELNRKIKEHRKKIRLLLLIIIAAAVVFFVAVKLVFTFVSYDEYKVVSSVERNDSPATQVCSFSDGIVKYSNDGISYLSFDGKLIWNQTFEMENPEVDVCGKYITVYDSGGKQIYILNNEELKGSLSTSHAIMRVRIAEQGNVAVLTEDGSACDIQMYRENGLAVAKGEIHIENSGYPMDIALSDDGIKLAVAMLDVTNGSVKTSVGFYNFSSVGQNEIDNIVGTYSYSGTMMPRIEFVTNDVLFAFGDNQLVVFAGTQKPEQVAQVSVKNEIKSIFYNSDYMGIVTENENYFPENAAQTEGDISGEEVQWSEKENGKYRIVLFDSRGNEKLSGNFDMEYESISFMENGEICIIGDDSCAIYTVSGKKKFSYDFSENIDCIIPIKGFTGRTYVFVLDDEIDKVRLKV